MHNFKVGDRVVKKYPTSEKLWHGTVMGLGHVTFDSHNTDPDRPYKLVPDNSTIVVKWDNYPYQDRFDISRWQCHTVVANTLKLEHQTERHFFHAPSGKSFYMVENYDPALSSGNFTILTNEGKVKPVKSYGGGFGTSFKPASADEVLKWCAEHDKLEEIFDKYIKGRPWNPLVKGFKAGSCNVVYGPPKKAHQNSHEKARYTSMKIDSLAKIDWIESEEVDPWQVGGYLYTLRGDFEGTVIKKERYGSEHMFALKHPSGDIKTYFTSELYDATDKELIELEETQRLTRYEKIKSWAKGFFQACAITGILATAVGIGANSELIQDFVVMVMDHANLTQVNHENF